MCNSAKELKRFQDCSIKTWFSMWNTRDDVHPPWSVNHLILPRHVIFPAEWILLFMRTVRWNGTSIAGFQTPLWTLQPHLIILHFCNSQLHTSCVLLSTQAGANIILVVAKVNDRWRMCTGSGLFVPGLDTLCMYTRDYKCIFTQGSQYNKRQQASFVADLIWIQKGNPDKDCMAYFKSFWHKSSPTFLSFIDASQDQKGKDVIYQPLLEVVKFYVARNFVCLSALCPLGCGL